MHKSWQSDTRTSASGVVVVLMIWRGWDSCRRTWRQQGVASPKLCVEVDTKDAAPHESSTNLYWTGTGLEFTLPSAPLDRQACAQSESEKKSIEIGQIPFLENRLSHRPAIYGNDPITF